jgi:hypothetical protein
MGPVDPFIGARVSVSHQALVRLIPLCDRGIRAAESRLKLSRQFRLAGEIVALISSASVIAALLRMTSSAQIVALASGGLALFGSLISLLSTYFARLPQEDKGSLFQVYMALVETRVEAKQILQDIEAYLQIDLEDKYDARLNELIGKTNALCRNANSLLANLLQTG